MEPFLLAAMAIAIAVKMLGVAWVNVPLIISVGSLALINFINGNIFQPNKIENGEVAPFFSIKLLVRASYISISFILIGVLFKNMFWPGSESQLAIGTIIGGCCLVVLFLKKSDLGDAYNEIIQKLLYRLIFILAIAIFFISISNKELYRLVHKDDPMRIKLYADKIDHPGDKKYEEAFRDYILNKRRAK